MTTLKQFQQSSNTVLPIYQHNQFTKNKRKSEIVLVSAQFYVHLPLWPPTTAHSMIEYSIEMSWKLLPTFLHTL